MLSAIRTCQRQPLGEGVRVPLAMAAYGRQGNDTTTRCSSTNVCDDKVRASHLCRRRHASTPATRAALQAPSFRSHPVYAVLGPSSVIGLYDGNLRPWRRRISLWGGPSKSDQTQRPGVQTGAGGDGNALRGGAEELARLEQEVLTTLAGVCEPCTGKGVVALGLVQDLLVRGEKLLLLGVLSIADLLLFRLILLSFAVYRCQKSFGMKKNEKKLMLRDVVAQGQSRRIKTLTAIVFPEQCLCSAERPAKQGLSLSKQTAMGLWSCHREKAVKGACTVTQAARD